MSKSLDVAFFVAAGNEKKEKAASATPLKPLERFEFTPEDERAVAAMKEASAKRPERSALDYLPSQAPWL